MTRKPGWSGKREARAQLLRRWWVRQGAGPTISHGAFAAKWDGCSKQHPRLFLPLKFSKGRAFVSLNNSVESMSIILNNYQKWPIVIKFNSQVLWGEAGRHSDHPSPKSKCSEEQMLPTLLDFST